MQATKHTQPTDSEFPSPLKIFHPDTHSSGTESIYVMEVLRPAGLGEKRPYGTCKST